MTRCERAMIMKSVKIIATCSVLWLISATTGVATAAEVATTRSGPATTQSVSQEAAAALKNLLRAPNLRLSMDERSTAQRFEFLLSVSLPSGHSTTYRVARDHDRVSVLVRSADGLPFCYLTNGLFAGFDQKARGHVAVYERGAPKLHLILSADQAGGDLDFELGFQGRAERAEIIVDVESVLRGISGQLRQATLDKDKRLLGLRTENATLVVYLPAADDPDDFGIKGLALRSKSGTAITLSEIRLDSKPSKILKLDKKSFQEIGLPLRSLTNEEVSKLSLFVPLDFPSDAERKGVEELVHLISSDSPSVVTPPDRHEPTVGP